MEDHIITSVTAGTGRSSVTTVKSGTNPKLHVLCDRLRVLDQNAGSSIQPDSYLSSRNRELERSERSCYQLATASHLPSMQHYPRLEQRLYTLREEVRTMTQEKERGERVWRERLQRSQRQLKAKEDEMSRQSQYFENFKTQLQHKLNMARDREQSLQNRIYTLEKQLLDMSVSAATGVAASSAVRITAATVTHHDEQEKLPSMREEGEGEEEKNEERRRQWQPNIEIVKDGRQEGDEGKTEKEEGSSDSKQNSSEARLQDFILSLQEDLRVLLEREESGMTERRRLTEQLQEAQENSQFLCCKLEEMKAAIHQLSHSESSLMEEVEELRVEHQRLQQDLRDATNQTPSPSSTIPKSTCPVPGTSLLSCSPVVCSVPSNTNATGYYSDGNPGMIKLTSDQGDGQPPSSAVPPSHHQATPESADNYTEDPFSSAKSGTKDSSKNVHLGCKSSLSFQSLSLASETIDECQLGSWCSRGVFNLEETPSEESDALREAYRSLGLGLDLEALQEQCDRLKATLQHTQEQLQVTSRENAELKLQLTKQAEEHEAEAEQWSSREKISTTSICDGADHVQSCLARDNILTKEDLVQALNQENRALASRIQELLAHIELSEGERKEEQTKLRKHVSGLEEDRARWEQEKQELGCLIIELTRKTEDDLNTIMELQQKLDESGERKEESQGDKEMCDSSVSGLVESVLKGEEEPQLISSKESDITASAPDFQCDKQDLLPNSSESILQVSDQVDQLTKSIQSLKTEQEELTSNIISLREQQGEVALSVQTQTEEKHQLTRTVWGLKEEKDVISGSLDGLKQEKEHLNRNVCGLKDERQQLTKSISSLKEEKEQLTKCFSGLERENEKLLESLSNGKEERNPIVQSLQCLQGERDQLSQTELSLKLERDEQTDSAKRPREQRDQEQLCYILQGDHDKLVKSVSSLTADKDRIEHSISCLKQEETQIMLVLQARREERSSLLTGLHSQTQEQNLLNINSVGGTQRTEALVDTADPAEHRCQTNNYKGNSIQGQSDLMMEIEALRTELKRAQEELDNKHMETERLHSELCQSEFKREEAEKKAVKADETVKRLTDLANQMEETSVENDCLTTQVKDLQIKLTGLLREKTDTLSVKAQIEEQYNVLTAQLKAKTVALEELNSEYISLKQGRDRDDVSTVLVSLRTRYNDIRAKYDALLKNKSQADLDTAPLKAKLSCLVVKCQERNSLLVQMMKAMHKHGCMDSTLKQQVDQLLADTALHDYMATFTPGSYTKTQDYSSGFAQGFILRCQDHTNGFKPDPTCSAALPPINQQHQNKSPTEQKNVKHDSSATTESTTNHKDYSRDVISAPTLKKNANSPVPTCASVQLEPSPNSTLKEGLSPNAIQLTPSAGEPEKCCHPDIKALSSPVSTSSSEAHGSSPGPVPPFSVPRVSVSRRLSSPEKIINLHEQLQQTLLSSYQTAASRGRGQQPRKSQAFPASADLSPSSLLKQQNLSVTDPHPHPLPVTTASRQAELTPATTTKPAAQNMSTTLFNAVASRSAKVSFSPNMLTNHHFRAAISPETSVPTGSSISPITAGASHTACTDKPTSPKMDKQTAIPDVSAEHTASLTPRTTTVNSVSSAATYSDVLKLLDPNPKTTAVDMTATSMSTAPKANMFCMTSKRDSATTAHDGLLFTTSCGQSAHRSPERSSTSATKSSFTPEKTKPPRPKPEAPADVRSVEVIRTVGQSSLIVGWERPPLDELGCSNGTFVYGYRVFVDGDFHKSIMSSACTKCVLENVDLSVPAHISVQTLGSNGLTSNSVQTKYRTYQH